MSDKGVAMILPLPSGTTGEDAVLQFALWALKKYDCRSFLDAGCGDGKYTHRILSRRPMTAWAVDAHAPSLQEVSASVLLCGEMPDVLEDVPDEAVEGVICLDVVEHLEKHQALKAMREMERIASKVVVLFTPYGFMPQPPLPGNLWMEHKCGFSASELHYLGYETYIWEQFDYGNGRLHDGLWGVKEK